MPDNFSKYMEMKENGASPHEVYYAAIKDMVDPITMYRLLRSVFHLSLIEAKEIIIVAEGEANSLLEHQDKIGEIMTQHRKSESVKPSASEKPSN